MIGTEKEAASQHATGRQGWKAPRGANRRGYCGAFGPPGPGETET